MDVLEDADTRCGKPAVRFYRRLVTGAYFSRCEEHEKEMDPREARRQGTPGWEEITWEEFLVAKVMQS
jgi:hypothetical protein